MTKIWSFLAFGFLVCSVVLHIVSPEYKSFILGLYLLSALIFSVLCILNRKLIKTFIKSHYFKNAFSSLISLGLIFAILMVFNYLIFKNDKSFDLTTSGYHSLSDQTKKILSSLDSPLKMTLFAKRGDWDYYLANIEKYDFASKLITLEAIDIDSDLALVRHHKVTENGSLLIEYKGRKVNFKIESELNITNNILKVLRERDIKVYFTTGHGELDFQSKKKLGAEILAKAIVSSNYKLIPLDLLRENIPRDNDALLITAPKYGFLDSEIAKLEGFLNRGGNLVLLLQANLLKTNFQNLYELLQRNGVVVKESIVIDRLAKTLGSEFTTPVVSEFSTTHRITKDFKGRILFPLSLVFEKESSIEQSVDYGRLAWTAASPATWAETDVEGVIAGKSALDEKDIKGPVTLAVAISNKKNQSKIVLFGSGTFISNAFESQSNNFNFFLNSLSWILDDEGIISLDRPGLKNSKVLISLSQETLILFFILICIPGIFFVLGFYFYRRALSQ